jgi:hypothetical protein
VPFGQDRNVQLRAEVFNVFNRANFDNPNGILFTSATASSPTFGRITATSTSSRQVQFAVKVLF